MADNQSNRDQIASDVEIPLRFGLGEASMPFGEFRTIQPGFVFELDGDATHPVVIEVNGAPVARGGLVLVEGRLGVGDGHGSRRAPLGRVRPAPKG